MSIYAPIIQRSVRGLVDSKTLDTMAMATTRSEASEKKMQSRRLYISHLLFFVKSLGLEKHGWREGKEERRKEGEVRR